MPMALKQRFSLFQWIASFFMLLLFCSHQSYANNLDSTFKEGDFYTLTIMHTNDIHGHVNDLPYYSTIIKQARSEAKNMLLLDGGDIFLRGEFPSYQGQVEADILNSMGYDAWVLGNNDFRIGTLGGSADLGNELLKSLTNMVNYPTLCANVILKETGEYIEGVKPYIIKDVNGVKVGIIGVTSMKPQLRQWKEVSDKVFENGDIVVKRLISEVKQQADVVIVLSHTGLALDLNIADIEGVSAVLGADDHFKLVEPLFKTNKGKKSTPITQNGGEENHFLGRLDLIFKVDKGQLTLTDFSGKLYDYYLVQPDKNVQQIITDYRELVN